MKFLKVQWFGPHPGCTWTHSMRVLMILPTLHSIWIFKINSGEVFLPFLNRSLGCRRDHEGYIPLMSLCVKTQEKWGQVDLMSYVHVSQWGKKILENTRGWFLYCSAWTNLLVAVETHEGYIPLMSLCVKTRGKWGQVDLMSYVHVSQWGKHILEYHKIVCLFKKDGWVSLSGFKLKMP